MCRLSGYDVQIASDLSPPSSPFPILQPSTHILGKMHSHIYHRLCAGKTVLATRYGKIKLTGHVFHTGSCGIFYQSRIYCDYNVVYFFNKILQVNNKIKMESGREWCIVIIYAHAIE